MDWFILLLLLLVGTWLLVEVWLIHFNPLGRLLERAEDHLDNPRTGPVRRRFWRGIRSAILATALTLVGMFIWRSVADTRQTRSTKSPRLLTDAVLDAGTDLARKAATQAAEQPAKAKQTLRNLAETAKSLQRGG